MSFRSLGLFSAIALVVASIALAIVEGGCSSATERRAENAIVNAAYERELEHCKEQGKVSHSFEVYEACADAVDRRLCIERKVRCHDAGR